MAYQPIPTKNEDDASANADPGVPILAVRKGTPANTSGADGDYEHLQISGGRLWVDASGAAVPITDNSGSLTVDQGTASNLNAQVVGEVAAGSADSGNPVKTGGKYNATNPTLTDGNRGDIQLGLRGSLRTELWAAGSATSLASVASNADGQATGTNPARLEIASREFAFNGSTFDRTRNNEDVTLLASASRTTTQTSADLVNYNGKSAIIVVVDVTSAGTGSITFSLDGKDGASAKYYNILTGSAITTNSTNRYRIGPDLADAANSVAKDYLPRTFRIVITANNANAMTYSVGYCLVRG
jgi:hypothetical protein